MVNVNRLMLPFTRLAEGWLTKLQKGVKLKMIGERFGGADIYNGLRDYYFKY